MAGFSSSPSTGLWQMLEGNLQSGNGSIFQYCSSDAGTDIQSTGYFKNVGAGSIIGLARGIRVGDLICNVESSGGVTPGRVTWHAVVSSTANSSTLSSTYGYDCSVSVYAST